MSDYLVGYKCLLCPQPAFGMFENRLDLWQHIDGYHRDAIISEWSAWVTKASEGRLAP